MFALTVRYGRDSRSPRFVQSSVARMSLSFSDLIFALRFIRSTRSCWFGWADAMPRGAEVGGMPPPPNLKLFGVKKRLMVLS